MSEPNHVLRAARAATTSPRVPGAAMSREELAEAVNAWLEINAGRRGALDERTVRRYEQGQVRWPGRDYRAAFAAVLGTDSLGFHPTNRHPVQPEGEARVAEQGRDLLPSEWNRHVAGDLADALAEGNTGPVTAATASRLTHEWLVVPPPQTVQLAAGRRIGPELAGTIARRVESLRRLDDFVAGGDLHG
ncbi:MAG: helix-turn-helix domain-containing protein, partial [Sciscionella sp.]